MKVAAQIKQNIQMSINAKLAMVNSNDYNSNSAVMKAKLRGEKLLKTPVQTERFVPSSVHCFGL